MKPGIYEMSMAEYQADPAPEPSLSSGIAKLLCSASPLHAFTAHPRLNPDYVPEADNPAFDLGTVVHALVLEGMNLAEILDFDSWRTDKSKDARAAARKAGRIPILVKDWPRVERMAARIREQLDEHRDSKQAFLVGEPERVLVWREENGVWCRARLDWLTLITRIIYDLKTTGLDANPDKISRTLFGNGLDIQAAFYLRGLKAVAGIDAEFRFVFVETQEPHALSVIGLGPDSLMIGEKKVLYAVEKFGECLEAGSWPGYTNRTAYAELPAWEENKWLERETQEL